MPADRTDSTPSNECPSRRALQRYNPLYARRTQRRWRRRRRRWWQRLARLKCYIERLLRLLQLPLLHLPVAATAASAERIRPRGSRRRIRLATPRIYRSCLGRRSILIYGSWRKRNAEIISSRLSSLSPLSGYGTDGQRSGVPGSRISDSNGPALGIRYTVSDIVGSRVKNKYLTYRCQKVHHLSVYHVKSL